VVEVVTVAQVAGGHLDIEVGRQYLVVLEAVVVPVLPAVEAVV
jgi:hypothetical protein